MNPRRRRLVNRLLTTVLMLAALGVILAVVLKVSAVGWDVPDRWFTVVPLIVVMSSTPLYLDRYDSWLVVGLESCVLVFLVMTVPWQVALAFWVIGVLLAQFVPAGGRYKLFNASITIVCGGIATALILGLGRGAGVSANEVLAVWCGLTAFYVVDVAISVLSLDLEARHSGTSADRLAEIAVLYAIFLAVNTLGYVAVLVHRATPDWTLLLFLPLLAIILLAVRSLTGERETARRLSALFATASAMHSARTSEQVLEEIHRGVSQFGKAGGAGLRREPPRSGEIGRPFIAGEDVHWLVLPSSRGPSANTLSNAEALSSMVQQGEEALSRMRMNTELTFNAEHDPLTSLTNRAVFLDRVDTALAQLRRRPGRCAVLFCDLDGFKKVNDQFGHQAGDAALIETAHRLDGVVPGGVMVARLGGDEFAVLISDIRTAAMCEQVCDLIRGVVAEPFEFDSNPVVISVSIGVAYSDGMHTADQLLRNADIAMYTAKRAGRDQVVEYHPSMGTARVKALELVDQLRHAIDERDLRVVYQPIVSAGTQRVLCVEALARWTYRGEVIPPETFIRVAEESNLIEALGELVLELVVGDAPVLSQALEPDVTIAVNISARQLRSDRFVALVERANAELAPHPLALEITETEAISDEVIGSSLMETMIAQGITFVVDDFGIGFSSMGYLMRLPVQGLKMDRLFSGSIDRDSRSADLLGSMISMGRALDLAVVVEGIERQSQIDRIEAMVGPEAFYDMALQGYLLGAPMSPHSLVQWARHRHRAAMSGPRERGRGRDADVAGL